MLFSEAFPLPLRFNFSSHPRRTSVRRVFLRRCGNGFWRWRSNFPHPALPHKAGGGKDSRLPRSGEGGRLLTLPRFGGGQGGGLRLPESIGTPFYVYRVGTSRYLTSNRSQLRKHDAIPLDRISDAVDLSLILAVPAKAVKPAAEAKKL